MFPRIQKCLKNKYSLTKNKSTFESSFNNLTNIIICANKYKKNILIILKINLNRKIIIIIKFQFN